MPMLVHLRMWQQVLDQSQYAPIIMFVDLSKAYFNVDHSVVVKNLI